MALTRREKRVIRNTLAFITLAPWAGAWGLMLEVGVLHSWWHFIPSMSMSVAGQLSAICSLVAFILFILKLVLLED